MLKGAMKNRVLVTSLGFVIAAASAMPLAYASDAPNLRGQWVGNSLLEGQRETAKTTLSLGALDDADSVTLRIEGHGACTLRQGSYATTQGADGAAAWSLSFKEARGGDSCQRLAQGNFSLRAASNPRVLSFDVVYPNRDGTQNHRSGTLGRYP